MIMTNKLLPVALIAALVGGSVGALVMHSKNQPASSAETLSKDTAVAGQAQTGSDQFMPTEFNSSEQQSAYKVGFADGFRAAEGGAVGSSSLVPATVVSQPAPVYRNSRQRYASSSRPVYYSNQPRSRSFWQKHRDKLTVAIGAGSGALLGGVIGGKKGAGIGALAGGGGSALYTYKLRNRNRRH